MNVLIHFGNVCNMHCSYCANSNFATPRDTSSCMSLDVLNATIDFVNDLNDLNEIALFGGEPTVYKDVFAITKNLNPQYFLLLTNGLLSKKLEEVIDSGNRFEVHVTVHHDFWRTNRDVYVRALLDVYEMLLRNVKYGKVKQFAFKLLVDMQDMATTKQIADWLFTNLDDAHIEVYHVRRVETQEEFLKTYLAAKRYLPAKITELLYSTVKSMVQGNPFYNKLCAQYANYLAIFADGHVQSSLCEQALLAPKNVTDPSFSLTPCQVVCKQRVTGCFGTCLMCNNVQEADARQLFANM